MSASLETLLTCLVRKLTFLSLLASFHVSGWGLTLGQNYIHHTHTHWICFHREMSASLETLLTCLVRKMKFLSLLDAFHVLGWGLSLGKNYVPHTHTLNMFPQGNVSFVRDIADLSCTENNIPVAAGRISCFGLRFVFRAELHSPHTHTLNMFPQGNVSFIRDIAEAAGLGCIMAKREFSEWQKVWNLSAQNGSCASQGSENLSK